MIIKIHKKKHHEKGDLKEAVKAALNNVGSDFFVRFWEESWTYIKTVVDVIHEPIVILNKNFCVRAANEAFYRVFETNPEDTEKKKIYELGNGQWNIEALRKLLEEILPKKNFFQRI